MEATVVSQIANAVGDVAVFTGFFHAVHIEEYLKEMGYVLVAQENELQMQLAKYLVLLSEEGQEALDDDEVTSLLQLIQERYPTKFKLLGSGEGYDGMSILSSLPAASSKVFDWMLG